MPADVAVHDGPPVYQGFGIQAHRGQGAHHVHHGAGPLADGAETTPARRPGLNAPGHPGLAGAARQGYRSHAEEALLIDTAHLLQAFFGVEVDVGHTPVSYTHLTLPTNREV